MLAAITGAVFEDANHSFQQDAGEVSAPRRLVYIDGNDNAQLDVGERFVVAEPDGTFEFPNLADGNYLLRLFNGTQTQTQTVPVQATVEGEAIAVSDALQLGVADGMSLALTTNSVVAGDLELGSSQTIAVGSQLTKMQPLTDGSLLVVGSDAGNQTLWTVNPATGTVTPLESTEQGVPWSEVAVDGHGRGVLLELVQDAETVIRTIDASTAGVAPTITLTSDLVPADTQVLTSQTGSRSVFAWSGNGGLELSLWSNVTSSFITTSATGVSGSTELLSFDDASGLLAVRTASGGVGVYDVDAGFAPLHTIDDATGPVTIDGARDLLLTVSPVDAALKLINLRDGKLIADMAIDLSAVGQVASLTLTDRTDAVVVLGAAGVTEVALRKSAGHRVTIAGNEDPDPVLFGVVLDGENTAPSYSSLPTLVTNEDTQLTLPAPTARNGSSDAEGDQYVLVQRGQPANGDGDFRIDGSVSYIPDTDFNGSDTVQVLLHDGRDASFEVALDIRVNAVPDSPTGVTVDIDPVPENLLPGVSIGTIEVIDADGIGGGHGITVIDDPRFDIRGGDIIFIGGDINFEEEPFISIGISISDPETSEIIEEIIAVSVQDEDDPIEGITPTYAHVPENAPGEIVAQFGVLDEDADQVHTFTVDDSRFIFEGPYMRLADGESLDYEKEPEFVVNVTATSVGGGDSYTEEVTIYVDDIAEQPTMITLSNQSVMELVPGDIVGEISLDDASAASDYELTVNDSRFEIVGTTLKLVDDQFVERAFQTEIELKITADDTKGRFLSLNETFLVDVLENEAPYHNQDHPYDVNHSGDISASDALAIINYLNTFGPGPIGQGDPGLCYDVNADGMVTALDALLVLNEMNRLNLGGGNTVGDGEQEAEPEGEQVDRPQADGEQIIGGQLADNVLPLPAPGIADYQDARPEDQALQQGPSDWVDPASRASHGSDAEMTQLASDAIDIPTRTSSDEFADNVDETLRLLSDDV